MINFFAFAKYMSIFLKIHQLLLYAIHLDTKNRNSVSKTKFQP